MKSGGARPNRARFVSGTVAAVALAVGVGTAAPAPAQVEPLGPEVVVVDGFAPTLIGYEDCDGELFTEEQTFGVVFVDFDDAPDPDTVVGISFSGSLADDLVDPPTQLELYPEEAYGEAVFEVDAVEPGDLTVTVQPGVGYVAAPDDAVTLEVTGEVEEVLACEDLGTPPGGTDRQTIAVGERPVPIGFFDGADLVDDGGDPGLPPPSEATETTAVAEPSASAAAEEQGFGTSRAGEERIVPHGFSTPVANGTLPPGLTYADDEWEGAATTPGTYAFDVRICLDGGGFREGRSARAGRPMPRALPDVLCLGEVDVVIEVEAASAPAPAPTSPTAPTAPPATPVVGAARFTG